jgi:pimeloyl-ACP methyl ester carboxylesterase
MLSMIRHPAAAPEGLPPLLIAHGLFGSGRNWGVIARRLADRRDVVAVDMRNHGDSPHFPTQGYAEMGADLAEVVEHLGGRADVLGHSMGGKAAMMLALTRGDLVRKLVVADIAPVAYRHEQVQNVAAMRSVPVDRVRTRADADGALADRIDDPALRAFFLQSLDLRSAPPRWKLNLDVLETEMPKIVGWPDPAGHFDGPVLFLSGAESHYVRPENRETIRRLFPAARFAKIPGAGHWLHAEKPREFEETVRVFLG